MAGQHGHKGAGPKKSKGGPEKKYVKIPKLKKAPENPFDKFANSKKKHEVINRRVKGEDRNVGKARKNSIEARKNRLQQDYLSTKKTNSFADRRFGESDADLSLEDKMFLRFQKERVKKAKNVSIFNLDGGEDTLTHKGEILGKSNVDDNDWHSDDEDGHGGLDKEVVNSLHFGGFEATKGKGANVYGPGHDEADKAPKNRLDALQEIVMKSKLYKLQKKEVKEEQENNREKLDKDYDELLKESLLDFNKKNKKYDKEDKNEEKEIIDEYDVALNAMLYDVKTKPTDRTKSDEEKAIAAREQLEELESARLRRMNMTSDVDNKDIDAALNGGEGDKKKRKRITDDEVDNTFGSGYVKDEDEEDEDDEEEEDDEEDDDDDEEGDEDDNEENDDEDGDDDEDDDGDEEEEEEEDDWEVEGDETVPTSKDEIESKDIKIKKNKKVVNDENEETEEEPETKPKKGKKGVQSLEIIKKPEVETVVTDRGRNNADKAIKKLAKEGVNDEMPHKITCPSSVEEFDQLTSTYVKSAADLRELITRILAWNSVHLPGHEGSENKGRMHNFLDVLLKLFVRVGDSLSVEGCEEAEIQGQLDFLCITIFNLGQVVKDACPLLWGRTLKLMQNQLQKRLRDFVQGTRESCWPSLGQLLLLRLLGHVFAVTDMKHAIVGPASLYLCQCLSQCPVKSYKDVASGLMVSSILIEYNNETKRVLPECLEFLRSVICLYCDEEILQKTTSSSASIFKKRIIHTTKNI